MKLIKLLGWMVAILLGVVMFIYADYDDSPGGQMLGLLVAIAGVIGIVRIWKNSRRSDEEV